MAGIKIEVRLWLVWSLHQYCCTIFFCVVLLFFFCRSFVGWLSINLLVLVFRWCLKSLDKFQICSKQPINPSIDPFIIHFVRNMDIIPFFNCRWIFFSKSYRVRTGVNVFVSVRWSTNEFVKLNQNDQCLMIANHSRESQKGTKLEKYKYKKNSTHRVLN